MTDLIHAALMAQMEQSFQRINGMASKLENIDVPCPVCHEQAYIVDASGNTRKCRFCHGVGKVMSKGGEV